MKNIALFFLLILASCSFNSSEGKGISFKKKEFTTEVSSAFNAKKYNRIAVFPLVGEALDLEGQELRDHITDKLVGSLDVGTSFELANIKDSQNFETAVTKADRLAKPLFDKAALFGKELDASAVICGIINTFSERDGNDVASLVPAHVQFRLWFLEPSTGKILWSSTYDKKKEPLSDNLLSIASAKKEDFKFQTRETLLKQGFEAVSKSLEQLRTGK